MLEVEKEAHQQKAALKEAAFQGRSTILLGSAYQHEGGEGTVYSKKNYSLGETAFKYNNDDWSGSEDEEDFEKVEWDEEVLSIMKIDISGVHEDLSDMEQSSKPQRRLVVQGKQVDKDNNHSTPAGEESESAPGIEVEHKVEHSEKYPGSPQHGSGGSGEKVT